MKIFFTLISNIFFFGATMAGGPTEMPQFRSNLYIVDPSGEPVLMDGTLSIFDDQYSNDVDRYDARKMFNPSENWGMVRGSQILIVERKQNIRNADTVFFKMWNMRVIHYRLEFISKYFTELGLQATLIDNFLHTSTAISLTSNSYVDFSVTADAASKRADRFMLVFSSLVAKNILPLSFVATKASFQNGNILLNWSTANEKNMKDYTVEHSSDGTNFTATGNSVSANNNNANEYSFLDHSPSSGANYYRIRGTDLDGKSILSDVLKVTALNIEAIISLYPNPSTSSNINVRMHGQQEGEYSITLMSSFGNVIHRQIEKLNTASQLIKISSPGQLKKGVYRIEIAGPAGFKKTVSLLIND